MLSHIPQHAAASQHAATTEQLEASAAYHKRAASKHLAKSGQRGRCRRLGQLDMCFEAEVAHIKLKIHEANVRVAGVLNISVGVLLLDHASERFQMHCRSSAILRCSCDREHARIASEFGVDVGVSRLVHVGVQEIRQI